MKIEILGTGCPKCRKLYENALSAIKELDCGDVEVVKIENIREITDRGVMMTPAFVVDGQIKSMGKVLSPGEIKTLIA